MRSRRRRGRGERGSALALRIDQPRKPSTLAYRIEESTGVAFFPTLPLEEHRQLGTDSIRLGLKDSATACQATTGSTHKSSCATGFVPHCRAEPTTSPPRSCRLPSLSPLVCQL